MSAYDFHHDLFSGQRYRDGGTSRHRRDGDRHDRNYLHLRGLHDAPSRARLAVFRTHCLGAAHRACTRNYERADDRHFWAVAVRNARDLRKHGPSAQSIRVMDTTTTITARTIAVTTTNVPITPMGMAMTTNTVTATGTASSTRRSGPGHRCCGLRQRRIARRYDPQFRRAATAIPLGIAFLFARKQPSRRFTFGYGRVEDLAGLAVLLTIFSSAVVAGYESIKRLFHPQDIHYLWAVALASVIGFLG